MSYTPGYSLSDERITAMFFKRDEAALAETAAKYGKLFLRVAMNILGDIRDAEECENDTYSRLWDSIPPERPRNLGAYGAKIARNLALDARDRANAQKRGGFGKVMLELEECISLSEPTDRSADSEELRAALDSFLRTLPPEPRAVFILRYWYAEPLASLAERFDCGTGRIKSMLSRTRAKLREYLKENDINI